MAVVLLIFLISLPFLITYFRRKNELRERELQIKEKELKLKEEKSREEEK